jgi:sulfate permease, SulP family
VPAALGVERPDVENAAAGAAVAVGEFLTDPQWAVLGLLLLAVVLTAGLPRLHRSLPGSLVAVVVVTAVAEITGVDAATIGTLPTSLPVPALPDLGNLGGLLAPAAVVAFLSALESLLSARVADGMTDAPRSDADRELFGQGLANIASGVCGGMPATGAIARTAVNARAGARTRVASLTHAVLLAAVVYTASGLVGHVPLVALAGVLLVTAWRMVERHNVRAVLGSTRGDALVFGLTAVATVALDLVVAVGAGMALAVVVAVVRMAATARAVPEEVTSPEIDDDEEQALLARHVLAYRLDGPLFFGVAHSFLLGLSELREVRVVVLRMSRIATLDATGASVLADTIKRLEARGVTVMLSGVRQEHGPILSRLGVYAELATEHHVFGATPDAIAHARTHARRLAHRPGDLVAEAARG